MLTRSKARQMRAKASPVKKSSSVKRRTPSKKIAKKNIACFRKTRKANTPKGKAGSKYVVCVKSKKAQKGGFVRGRSVQQFVQSLFQ